MSKLEHEPCHPPFHWHARCILASCVHRHGDFASTPQAAPKLTEDPPFGGLWCDQPAIFLPARFGASPAARAFRLDVPAGEPPDDRHERIEIHRLGHVQIETRIDGGLHICRRRISRESDRDHLFARLKPSQLAHQ